MTKFVCTILILVLGLIALARGQQTSSGRLSDVDKTAIIESVLDLELRNQTSVPDFANIRDISSENIEFVESSNLSKHGFTLVAASDLRESKKDRIVHYLRFQNMSLRDDVAVVTLSRVTEGRPCFGAPISIERIYTYESRLTTGGWVAQLNRRPSPVVPFAVKRSAAPR